MSKIMKAVQRSRETRAVQEHDCVQSQAMLERKQLEDDIRRLVSQESPELLAGMKKQIQISYSKTRKISTDPDFLRRNHIFAF